MTQDPNTKNYMIVLKYYENGSLRNYLLNESEISCQVKIDKLCDISNGLLNIHNSGKVHKDFHSGNILCDDGLYIGDLGMCQLANNEEQLVKKGVHGVLPYIAPEVLRECRYTKAADIYSF